MRVFLAQAYTMKEYGRIELNVNTKSRRSVQVMGA
jgi:hypothetical protein